MFQGGDGNSKSLWAGSIPVAYANSPVKEGYILSGFRALDTDYGNFMAAKVKWRDR